MCTFMQVESTNQETATETLHYGLHCHAAVTDHNYYYTVSAPAECRVTVPAEPRREGKPIYGTG
jgi:hypothetical protein